MIKYLDNQVKLREDFTPKSWYDGAVTLFVLVIIPTVFWFELWVVLPTFYDQTEIWFMLHFVTGTLIMINVVGNFLGLLCVDTSIRGIILKPGKDWHLCAACEALVPPRAWHCDVCKTCILKRDHHCVFSGCCVGHKNQRFFLFFVYYIFIASFYSSYFNLFFVLKTVKFYSWMSLVKVVFPLAVLAYDFDITQLYLFLSLIVFIGCVFTGVLLFFHVDLMLKGMLTPERKHKANKYDRGIEENIKDVLGKNWFMTWLSPFIWSPLPHDGQVYTESTKDE